MTAPRAPERGLGASLAIYGRALALFVALDAVWLGLVARDFYPRHIGHLMAADVAWGAAVLFYLVFLAGVVTFVIRPSLEAGSPSFALTRGAFFGLVTYATYDLTNQATLRAWPVLVTVVDLAWGAALTGSVSYLTHKWVARGRARG